MTDQNFMNFFVEQAASDAAVVLACSRACGLPLESEACLQEGSVGFVQVIPYPEGFEMGLCIIWPPSTPVSLSQAAVAQDIARELRQRVLLDVEDPAAVSGERWMLATPDGAPGGHRTPADGQPEHVVSADARPHPVSHRPGVPPGVGVHPQLLASPAMSAGSVCG
ncbi:hypothetical protein [Micromonospora sp. NBC_01740]|uniref:hypothetical protein n=1 Tax=unclassified Micromonospora TaxID=2617518 RepID=UPI002E0D87BA|nr:hypothetical protein OG989_27880 [Micromonospora sp. NBC_01740]